MYFLFTLRQKKGIQGVPKLEDLVNCLEDSSKKEKL
jgi:hypothetical protein